MEGKGEKRGGRGRTDDKLGPVEVFQVHSVVARDAEHALYPSRGAFLAEDHLQDGLVDGLSGDLTPEVVQFSMRHFEHRCGVLVL